jgi:hypothetical protein
MKRGIKKKLFIITEAANRIKSGDERGICSALRMVELGYNMSNIFQSVFRPDTYDDGYYFTRDVNDMTKRVTHSQAKSDRLLALSLMYSMVEAGDL